MKNNWPKQREGLKKIYQSKGIVRCELRLEGCMKDFAMSFHHRHKRWWYIKRPELLGEFNQTVLACASCHDKAEASARLTEELFNKLRNAEHNT